MKYKVGHSRGVLFSGNANNCANAGLSYANSNNTPSNTNANIGSHLCFQNRASALTNYKRMTALPLGKKHLKTPKSVGKNACCIGY